MAKHSLNLTDAQRERAEAAWPAAFARLSDETLRMGLPMSLLYVSLGTLEWFAYRDVTFQQTVLLRLAPFVLTAVSYLAMRRFGRPSAFAFYVAFGALFLSNSIKLPDERLDPSIGLPEAQGLIYLISDLISFLIVGSVVLVKPRHVAFLGGGALALRLVEYYAWEGNGGNYFLSGFGIPIAIGAIVAYVAHRGRYQAARRNFFLSHSLEETNAELEAKNDALERSEKEARVERDRSEQLLLNILPKQTAEELKAKGKAQARSYESVSVLFSDFVGFTKIAEKIPPEQLVAELDDCFQTFDEIVYRHGLEKIKTIGDAYMAAGGLPEPNQTHARDCVNAALEMQHFLYEWNAELQTKANISGKPRPEWAMRIGIHTGPVVAGVVGKRKFQYDLWGDAVNVAARTEQHSEPGRVNLTEAAYEQVKGDFDCAPRGEVEAKNKGKIAMYFVEDAKKHVQKPFFFD